MRALLLSLRMDQLDYRISQPDLSILKRAPLGRCLGSRDRCINRATGKAKDMSSVIIAVPTKTMNARQYQYED